MTCTLEKIYQRQQKKAGTEILMRHSEQSLELVNVFKETNRDLFDKGEFSPDNISLGVGGASLIISLCRWHTIFKFSQANGKKARVADQLFLPNRKPEALTNLTPLTLLLQPRFALTEPEELH
jgi:hypothetical protein